MKSQWKKVEEPARREENIKIHDSKSSGYA